MTPPRTETPEGDIYEVFARFREKRLHHIGSVVARDDELAKMYAAKLYDEWGWLEMAIVKRADVTIVIAPV
jgi:1,2-phenylacetyl-CoA epoxidase PaaB subunit